MPPRIATYLVAMHARSRELDEIKSSDVYHFSPGNNRKDIVQSFGEKVGNDEQACEIHLKASQGWSRSFWKFIRDLTVADTDLSLTKSYGCYNYFFLGKPSSRNLKNNVGGKADGDDAVRFRIPGASLCQNAESIFYRPCGGVVVVRGDYRGPAFISPPNSD